MGKAEKQVVGVFALILGMVNLISAYLYTSLVLSVYSLLDAIPIPGIRDLLMQIMGLDIVIIGLALVGIFWIIIAIGLFLEQEWAVILTKILAILYLIGSLFTCNCIGFILAIIVLYLLKGEKEKKAVETVKTVKEKIITPDRRCPNCGRVIPVDAVICPYCGKKFKNYLDKDETKQAETKSKKEKDEVTKKTKYCHECGARIDEDAKFCPECGAKTI